MIELKIFNDREQIAAYTYRLLVGTVRERAVGTAGHNTFTGPSAALSFGSTYEPIFRSWADYYSEGLYSEGSYSNRLDTGRKEPAERTGQTGQTGPEIPPGPRLPRFFPADERVVPFEHPGSNWGAAWKSFLSVCGTKQDRAHWASDARTYRQFLTRQFGLPGLAADRPVNGPDRDDGDSSFGSDSGWPVFDLIFLGLGPDGHTASLFPGDCPNEGEPGWNDLVLETTAPFAPFSRLTLGPEVIARAGRLVLTVTGAGKAEIFSRFLNELGRAVTEGSSSNMLPPARIIRRRTALGLDTEILCDTDASSRTDLSPADSAVINRQVVNITGGEQKA